MAGTALFAATTQGWLCITLETGMTVFGSRKGWLVSSIAVADRHVLVSCPELAEVHSMMSWWDKKSGQVLDNRLAAALSMFETGMLPKQSHGRS